MKILVSTAGQLKLSTYFQCKEKNHMYGMHEIYSNLKRRAQWSSFVSWSYCQRRSFLQLFIREVALSSSNTTGRGADVPCHSPVGKPTALHARPFSQCEDQFKFNKCFKELNLNLPIFNDEACKLYKMYNICSKNPTKDKPEI